MNFDINIIKEIPKISNYKGTTAQDWCNLLGGAEYEVKEIKNMKYKVRALDTYEVHNITDALLQRMPKAGEEFEVDKERLDILTGENAKGLVFVEVIEEVKEENKQEEIKPKRTTRKKKVDE